MRKKSPLDFTLDGVYDFDKQLGLDAKFPQVSVDNLFGGNFKAKPSARKKLNGRKFTSRNKPKIFSGGTPNNYGDVAEKERTTNSNLFNFNPYGRSLQQRQQQ